MKVMLEAKKIVNLLKDTFNEFVADNALRLSAALSCYILFSLTPLLIIIISICGIFFGEQAVNGEVFDQLNELIGNRAAIEIQETIKTVKLTSGISLVSIMGILIALIAASGVFAEIQSAINFIWGIQSKRRSSLINFVLNRIFSFSIIGVTGLLLFVGLLINSLMDILNHRLMVYLPGFDLNFYYLFNLFILFILVIILFVIIFKVLPSGNVRVLDCLIGATFTSLLFMIGKLAIGTYLGHFAVTSIFGAAGTLLLILTWVYYSAIIFYFGVEFTKVYARTYGKRIG